MIREQVRPAMSGAVMLILGLAGIGASVWLFVLSVQRPANPAGVVAGILGVIVSIVLLAGLKVVNPNEARVLQLFGSYSGTIKDPGLRWAKPFMTKRRVSLRIRNFESSHLKVNDLEGNPIEIAAVVVWRVVDTAEALFEVDDYNNYVHVQSESALRNLATSYPYDVARRRAHVAARPHRRGRRAPEARDPGSAGEGRASRCSRRASATSPTRPRSPRRCCSGSRPAPSSPPGSGSSRARSAWSRWRWRCCPRRASSQLDEERKAAMVSNLLVVLCGERGAQPIVNTGTIYQ